MHNALYYVHKRVKLERSTLKNIESVKKVEKLKNGGCIVATLQRLNHYYFQSTDFECSLVNSSIQQKHQNHCLIMYEISTEALK